MRYVLNAAVVTRPGTYHYAYLTIEDAQAWLQKGPYYATIGYQETVEAFALLLNVQLEPNRETVRMRSGDEALVFRLRKRLPYKELKGELSIDVILDNFELGLLRRIV